MTGRERVLKTLNREPTDRIPYDLGGTDCSSVHIIAYQKLRAELGLAKKPVKCGCLVQLIADIDDDVKEALQVDAEALSFSSVRTKTWKTPFDIDLIVPEKFNYEEQPDGSTLVRNTAGAVYSKRTSSSFYFDPVEPPLAELSTPAQLDAFGPLFERWDYSYVYDEPLKAYGERAALQYKNTDRAVVALWRLHYLQSGQLMRGYEQFFIDLMAEKEMAHALLSKLHQVYLKRVKDFFAVAKDSIDVVFLTDDLGTQQSGLISPALYKEMIFPYISELVRLIKSYGKKVVMHSCGAVADFIPALIEMGVDGLNPVQVSANRMAPDGLVREYGKDIAFWGGGCDTQRALNAPDPETARADVRRRIAEFGPHAHWVFTQVHNIQYDVHPRNILAMRDEFWKQTRG